MLELFSYVFQFLVNYQITIRESEYGIYGDVGIRDALDNVVEEAILIYMGHMEWLSLHVELIGYKIIDLRVSEQEE